LEVAPHVSFCRRPFEDPAIGINEGQVLALKLRELWLSGKRLFAKRLIHLSLTCVSPHKEARMNIRYHVELNQIEREQLNTLLSGGRHSARRLKRAQILLAANEGVSDEVIATTLNVSGSTVYRTKRRLVEANLEGALSEEPRPGVACKLSAKEEALLVATACSNPPPGRARWTLELLADEMVKLTDHEHVSCETVRRRLGENHLKPWRRDMWCIPKIDGEYVARMEDVLDLYAEPADPQRPVICFDESPVQLIGEVREPILAKPMQPLRYDCEYRRNGTVNLFVFLDAHQPWRRVKVTDRRTNQDFADCMRELVDIDYPDAPIIRVVMDNLSTHSPGALYDAFPAAEARRVLKRLEFHHTPKHASWLNMVEIEIGVLKSQCLDRRIDHKDKMIAEVAAWQQQRNAQQARIQWMFTTEKAREKLHKAYPVKES
jgi:transposase